MHPVAALFGLASLGACLAALRSNSGAAQVLALSMAIVWACANQLAILRGVHLLPLVDLPTALSAYVVWFDGRKPWQAWACVLFSLRLPLHLFAAWGGIAWVTYLHTINALFLGALIAIAWTGGLNELVAGLRLRILHWVRAHMAKGAAVAAKASR